MPSITTDYDTQLGVVDSNIGARIRERRQHLGVPLSAVGAAMGIDGASVQKYETGIVRLPASRLYLLSKFLEVPIDFFFEDAKLNAPRLETTAELILEAFSKAKADNYVMSLDAIIAYILLHHADRGVAPATIRQVTARMGKDGRLDRVAGNGVYRLPKKGN